MAPKYTLSDSESEAEAAVPSDQALEEALRKEVTTKYKAKNFEELTVKRVRRAVEEKLSLGEGYFKNTGDWKAKSEEIIKDEFEILRTSAPELESDLEPEPAASPSPPPPEPSQNPTNKRLKAVSTQKPRKRQKTQTPVSDDEDELSELPDAESEEEVAKPQKGTRRMTKTTELKKSKEPSPEAPQISDGEEEAAIATTRSAEATKDDSESEMSIVLDEEPKPKATRKRKSNEGTSKTVAPKKEKKTAKGKDEDLDPDQAEIKRLQGWLVKCGIRKMWWRELQPYETSKAKIKHLKQMLEDAGMTGRYSVEKARQIRDERELKADLEQIQQGAKKWGTGSGDEGSDGPAPSRRAARGRQALAFLESEGEESD